MIEINENNTLNITKVIDEDINISKDVHFKINISKYLNLNLNITILKDSKPNIYIITKENTKFNLNITLEENSSLNLFIALFGKKNNDDIKINLIGKNSNINMSLISISNSGSSTYNTLINHINENTNSIINNSAILTNKAEVFMNIKSNIKKDSTHSNSKQSIEGLILDKDSKIEMIPTLLIDENNIFANHSSRIYRINENDLYYIMSKGISKENANKMYANNFLLKYTNENYKEEIKKLIERSI